MIAEKVRLDTPAIQPFCQNWKDEDKMEPLCQEWQYNQDPCGNMLCSSAKVLKSSCPDACTARLEQHFIALFAMIMQDHFVREVLACEVPFQRESRACN